MPDFQTFIAIVTTLLVFLTGVALKYDTIYFRNYALSIPQWAGLSFVGITFTFVVLDQLLRGFVRVEEEQRRSEDQARAEDERAEARYRQAEATERETRRVRIETRYRTAIIRFRLDPTSAHRQQLVNILALLEEYGNIL
ncbi:hypothetical protein [Synechocystis sp. CACIAM 05]|uniref:hypothetical protein n=1 Tax=Synechocystis sp. CACIAM 05 TaxID=1933929 RepID=UPI001F29CE85|nr:hypothetical protein [Synechocystis sp. CACIAM 05]